MTNKARRRKVASTDQVNEQEEVKRKHQKQGAGKSSSQTILVLLVVMVALTWGIAATAYFGVINYKALIGLEKEVTIVEEDVTPDKPPVTAEPVMESKDEAPATSDKQEKAEEATKSQSSKDAIDVKEKPKSKESPNKAAQDTKENKSNERKKKPKAGSKPDSITSEKDKSILKELQEGEKLLDQKKARGALSFFESLLSKHPDSPRATFGKARALFLRAEAERSNKLLQESINAFGKVGEKPGCPAELKMRALLTKVEKQHFLGQVGDALRTSSSLYKEFPKDVRVLNKLGVSYLWVGKNDRAEKIFKQALLVNPNDGFAQVHYGFIAKTGGNYVEGAKYLRAGIGSMEAGTQDGKFYMHLGDALHRTNRSQEAEDVYQAGADKGLFLSKYQRSLYNIDRLKSHPFWTPEQAKATSYVKKLEKNWKVIRDEALSIMDTDKGLFLPEEEDLKNTGDWKQLTLYQKGKRLNDCKRLPKTCAIIEKMTNMVGCTRGQVKFSIMQPGTHVWAHTGPTNCRLRMHLGLVIPQTGEGAKIRCADEYRGWQEGKVLIFDDSFEHEVWQNAESYRLILIADVWHPDVTEHEKKTLSPI